MYVPYLIIAYWKHFEPIKGIAPAYQWNPKGYLLQSSDDIE